MYLSLSILEILGGIVYLLMGGDLLVRGAVALARQAQISPMVVGLTVVALGTSAPELVVTLQAALGGYPDVAIANVIGSNIANVLLVTSIPALIYPLACDQKSARTDALFMLGVCGLFYLLCLDGILSRGDGFLLLAGLVLFLAMQARSSSIEEIDEMMQEELPIVLGLPGRPRSIALLLVVGGVMLPVGANLLVHGALGLADRFEIAPEAIGLTVIAMSTSVPELATTVIAALKRQADVAVGNVIGSNVLNILGIMGAASLASLREMSVPAHFLTFDLPLMVTAAMVLTAVTLRRGVIGQRLGGAMLGVYLVYTYLIVSATI